MSGKCQLHMVPCSSSLSVEADDRGVWEEFHQTRRYGEPQKLPQLIDREPSPSAKMNNVRAN